MNRMKHTLGAFWKHVKDSFVQAWEDQQAELRENSAERRTGVNPSTGLPLISESCDCMGTPFGMRDLSDDYRYSEPTQNSFNPFN